MRKNLVLTIILVFSSSCGPTPEEMNDEWFNYYNNTDLAIMNKLSEIMKRKGEYPSKEFCTNEYQLNQESRTGYKADGTPGTNFTPQYWSKIRFEPYGNGTLHKGVKQTPWHSIGYSYEFKIKWYLKLTTNPPYLGMLQYIEPNYESEEYIYYKMAGSEIIEQEPISFILEHFTDAEKKEWYTCVDSTRNKFMSKNLYIINDNGNFEKNENSWKDGKKNGKWTYWYNNGNRKKEIIYDSGNIINEWIFHYSYYANGKKEVQGKYRKDINGKNIFNGLTTWWYENGQKKSESTFNYEGGKEGLKREWYEDGNKKEESNYKNGKPDGKSIHFFKDGKIMSEKTYKGGVLDGMFTEYLDTGQKVEKSYKNGIIDGESTLWWDWEGKKKNRIGFFDNGEKTGLWTYWSFNGKETWEITYKDGKKWEGTDIKYYLNKQKLLKGEYRNGRRDGLWLLWYDNGSKWMEKTFKDGDIVQERCFDDNGNDSDCYLIDEVVF